MTSWTKRAVLLALPLFLSACAAGRAARISYESERSVAKVVAATPDGAAETFLGTGFVVSEAGFAVTSKHVIDAAPPGTLVYLDTSKIGAIDRKRPAVVVRVDAANDLALLYEPSAAGRPALRVSGPDTPRRNDAVVFLGFSIPQDTASASRATVASDVERMLPGGAAPIRMLRLRGEVSPGNSGGPVLRASDGTVVGVVTGQEFRVDTQVRLAGAKPARSAPIRVVLQAETPEPTGHALAVPAAALRALLLESGLRPR